MVIESKFMGGRREKFVRYQIRSLHNYCCKSLKQKKVGLIICLCLFIKERLFYIYQVFVLTVNIFLESM